MSAALQKCIFFAGGKRLEGLADDSASLVFERTDAGAWKIKLEMQIIKAETENVLRTFSDFNVPEIEFEDKYANQVYFEAIDDNGKFKTIDIDNIKISVFSDKDDIGGIVFSIMPAFTGKTQNGKKTQNAEVNG